MKTKSLPAAARRPRALRQSVSVASVTYEACEVYVEGMDLNCPLCGVLVASGEKHQCRKPLAQALPDGKARSKA